MCCSKLRRVEDTFEYSIKRKDSIKILPNFGKINKLRKRFCNI